MCCLAVLLWLISWVSDAVDDLSRGGGAFGRTPPRRACQHLYAYQDGELFEPAAPRRRREPGLRKAKSNFKLCRLNEGRLQ